MSRGCGRSNVDKKLCMEVAEAWAQLNTLSLAARLVGMQYRFEPWVGSVSTEYVGICVMAQTPDMVDIVIAEHPPVDCFAADSTAELNINDTITRLTADIYNATTAIHKCVARMIYNRMVGRKLDEIADETS
jgi:hypothetical protein